MISEREHELAEQRGREIYENVPHVVDAVYSPTLRRVLVTLSSGLEICLRQDDYSWMRHASANDLSTMEWEGSGLYLTFPELDEGFYIPSLLEHLLNVRRFLQRSLDQDRAELNSRAA